MPSTRLYAKGRVLGHKRGKRNTRPNTSLIQIEGVSNKDDAQFYLGKRLAYVYKAKTETHGSKVRVIWGRVTRSHGNSGVVKSKFKSNLPPHSFGASIRVVRPPARLNGLVLTFLAVDAVPVQHLNVDSVEAGLCAD
ncbi:ribosomal protein L35Ae-domain-containing protein [Auriculariales sp. MPI-PUGE-AT-0066]|nr:ribosomal protein L35Ae-domain-containing protein [Auriculariales sp. MPI-PUGE-AT-0066]